MKHSIIHRPISPMFLKIIVIITLLITSCLYTEYALAGNYTICGVDIGYSPGEFFTKNGSECTCHNQGKCTPVGHDASCNCRYTDDDGNSLGAVQCFGFARYVQSRLFGYNSYTNNADFYNVDNSNIAAGSLNATNLKNAVQAAKPGAHLRTNTSSPHSMIITEITDEGFAIVQCNGSNNDEYSGWHACRIGTHFYSWSEYVASTYGKRGIDYIELPINYDLEDTLLSIEKNTFSQGDHTTFYYSGNNGNQVNLIIYKDNALYKNLVTSNAYDTFYFTEAGSYAAYYDDLNNDIIIGTSNIVYFTVQGPPTLSLEKNSFLIGEHTTFYYDASNCTHVNLKIFKNNYLVNSKSTAEPYDTFYFTEEGTYSAYYDSVKDNTVIATSNTLYFTVQKNYAAPSAVSLELEKNNFVSGEHTTFYCYGSQVLYYVLSVYKDGELYETQEIKPYTYYTNNYTKAGSYTAYAEAYNSTGKTFSNAVDFTVSEKVKFELEKNNFLVGEHTTFYYEASNCTHVNLKIFKNNYLVNSKSTSEPYDTFYFTEEGTYSAYYESVNDNTVIATSKTLYFTVQNSYTPPTNVKLALERNNYLDGGQITFKCSGSCALYYILSLYKDGNLLETKTIEPFHEYTNNFDVGEYTAYVEAYNHSGNTRSATISFTISGNSVDFPVVGGTMNNGIVSYNISSTTLTEEAKLLIVQYDVNGKMKAVQTKTVTLGASGSNGVSEEFSDEAAGDYYKTFLLNNSTYAPLCKAQTI